MGTHFQATACPLCGDDFDEPGAYRDHLAMMHDLVDDEGTETTLVEDAEPEPDPEPFRSTDPVMARSIDHNAVADPDTVLDALPARAAGRPRFELSRHLVPGVAIFLAVQVLLGLLGLAVVVGDGEGDKTVTTEAAADAPTFGSSGGGKSGEAKQPDAKAPATTAPPATVDTRNDQSRAEAIIPQIADFPAGWVAVSAADLDDASSGSSATDACTVPNDPTEDPSIAGAGFGFEHEASFASGAAMVLKSEDDAQRAMSILRQQSACIGDGMAQDLEDVFCPCRVTHGAFSSLGFPTYGDDSVAMSMPITVVGDAISIPLRIDILAIRRDRAIVFVLAIVGANDFTPTQERGAMSAIEARMAPKAI